MMASRWCGHGPQASSDSVAGWEDQRIRRPRSCSGKADQRGKEGHVMLSESFMCLDWEWDLLQQVQVCSSGLGSNDDCICSR